MGRCLLELMIVMSISLVMNADDRMCKNYTVRLISVSLN